MTAQLFLIIPAERAWIRAPYPNSPEHIAQLRQEIADIKEDEAERQSFICSLQQDSIEARLKRRRLQNELYQAEYEARAAAYRSTPLPQTPDKP